MSHEHDHQYWHGAGGFFRILALAVGGVAVAVIFAFIFGLVVQALWNWLMPMLFSLKAITFWQAFGLVLLAKILFGGCGGHGYGRWHRRDKVDWPDGSRGPFGRFRMRREFRRYWEEEGRQAFKTYLDKKGPEENPEK